MKKNSTGVLPATNPEVVARDGGRGLEGDREDRAADERRAPTHLTGGEGNRRARRRDVPTVTTRTTSRVHLASRPILSTSEVPAVATKTSTTTSSETADAIRVLSTSARRSCVARVPAAAPAGVR
jgi:hypothetical protein